MLSISESNTPNRNKFNYIIGVLLQIIVIILKLNKIHSRYLGAI